MVTRLLFRRVRVDAIDRALLAARVRGFLVTEVAPNAPPGETRDRDLFSEWNAYCADSSKHRVLVFPHAESGWCVLLAFHRGVEGEMRYVLDALLEAFVRHLGHEPSQEEPDVWSARTTSRSTAEAVAFELVANDCQLRDVDLEDAVRAECAESTTPGNAAG